MLPSGVIKHSNGKSTIDDLPSQKPPFLGYVQLPCLITRARNTPIELGGRPIATFDYGPGTRELPRCLSSLWDGLFWAINQVFLQSCPQSGLKLTNNINRTYIYILYNIYIYSSNNSFRNNNSNNNNISIRYTTKSHGKAMGLVLESTEMGCPT